MDAEGEDDDDDDGSSAGAGGDASDVGVLHAETPTIAATALVHVHDPRRPTGRTVPSPHVTHANKAAPMLLRTLDDTRAVLASARERGQRVGFVPTMGALHDGHLALVREARKHAQKVVVSVFVNPTQFGPGEDFTRYPRDLEGDLAKCASAGADVVFSPSDPSTLYPAGEETRVRVGATAQHLEGTFRPTHFEGVATVCTKLFLAIGPCVAVFGRKDYQQLAVIRRVVSDLFLPVEIIGLPTVREDDGLAMSSRNAYLSPEDRLRARCLSRGLDAAIVAFEEGAREVSTLESMARAQIEPAVDSIDYVTVADADSVTPLPSSALVGDRAVLAIAAHIGKTRLIDNVVLGEERDVADRVAAFDGRVR